jgi:hypothetical protein
MQIFRLATSSQLSGCILASAIHPRSAKTHAFAFSSCKGIALAGSVASLLPVANSYLIPQIPRFSQDIARRVPRTWVDLAGDNLRASRTKAPHSWANPEWLFRPGDASCSAPFGWPDSATSYPVEVN